MVEKYLLKTLAIAMGSVEKALWSIVAFDVWVKTFQ